jgi:hypothetical protein
MRKNIYVLGEKINKYNICYVSDADSIFENKGTKRRVCNFKCHCSKIFTSRLSDIIQNKRKSCGCMKGNKPFVYKNGDLINEIKFIKSCGTTKHAQRAIFECPICKKEWESNIGNIMQGNTKSCCRKKRGWSKSQWVNISENAKLYKVKLYNDNENFIKIGITTKNIKDRFKSIPYKYEIIKVIEGSSGYIFDLENKTKRMFKKHRYTPLIKFKGKTECYNL